MHKFFKYLESVASGQRDSGEPESGEQEKLGLLRKIWDSSSSSSFGSPDVEGAWQRLERRVQAIEEEGKTQRHSSPKRATYRRPLRIAIPVGLAVVILIAVFFGPSMIEHSYRTGSEPGLTIYLPDSSTVTLGRNSVLSTRKSVLGSRHDVSVLGEAYFDMKPQTAPFMIRSPQGVVRVVGTRFDVRCDVEHLFVTVTHGTVSVRTPHSESEVFVHEGECLTSDAGATGAFVRQSFRSGEPMWLTGTMTVKHASMKVVCEEIGRELGVEITVTNPTFDTLTVTGLIRGKDATQVLTAITGLTGTAFRPESHGYVVY